MPSGKQILLSLLQTYSQQGVDAIAQPEVTDRLKAGLLLHASTAEETWAQVERIAWVRGEGVQGLGVARTGTLALAIFEALIGDHLLPEHVAREFPGLSQADYEAAVLVLWAVVSQVCFYDGVNSVENGGALDQAESERLIANYREKLALHRKDPGAFFGRK